MSEATSAGPGQLLLHPASLMAVAVLVVNDHVLKGQFGNALTGKLSDVAGVFLFPFLVLGVWAVLVRHWQPWPPIDGSVITGAVVATAVGFAAVKLIGPVGNAYEWVIGSIRWAARLGRVEHRPIVVVRDPSDVLVLPVLIGSSMLARRGMAEIQSR